MIVSNIEKYHNGWFVGNFSPAIFKSPQFELAHHTHLAMEKTTPHIHKETTELNYVISGELIVSDRYLTSGDIWIYEKGEVSDVRFLSNTSLIILRWPSIPGDKYDAPDCPQRIDGRAG